MFNVPVTVVIVSAWRSRFDSGANAYRFCTDNGDLVCKEYPLASLVRYYRVVFEEMEEHLKEGGVGVGDLFREQTGLDGWHSYTKLYTTGFGCTTVHILLGILMVKRRRFGHIRVYKSLEYMVWTE